MTLWLAGLLAQINLDKGYKCDDFLPLGSVSRCVNCAVINYLRLSNIKRHFSNCD